MSWSEAKNYTALKVGEVDDKSFTNVLIALRKYGFIEKVGEEYKLVDPLISKAIKKIHM